MLNQAIRQSFGCLVLVLMLSACIGVDGTPPGVTSSATGSGARPGGATVPELAEATACPEPTADAQLLRHDVHGYCLLYPTGYEVVEYPTGYSIGIWAPPETEGHRERLFINVEDAAGRTLEDAVNQLIADYSLPGMELEATRDLVIDGEEAAVVDNIPGQELNRRLLIVRDGLLYQLMFLPSMAGETEDYPGQAAAHEQMEELYAAVVDSLTFIPIASHSGDPGLAWQGQVDSGDRGVCRRLHLFRNEDALIGPCDAEGEPVRLTPNQAREWMTILSLFAPFEIENAAEQLAFYGSGQTAGPAWQRAIASWARFTYQELESGQTSAAAKTVLSWWLGEVPQHPGYCAHLLVLVHGYAYIRVDPCQGGGEPLAIAETWLETGEMEQFDAWLYSKAPVYHGDSYFAGLGTEEMTEAEIAELAQWAQNVYSRIEQATPSYLEEEAATSPMLAGRIIYGSRQNGNLDLYIMYADGGGPQPLTESETWDGFPTPSPDGNRIAFVAETMDSTGTPVEREIFVVNSDGTGLANLTNAPGLDMEPDWSPDGNRIAFSSTRGEAGFARAIYLMDAGGGNVQLLVENADQPDWSPDSSHIAFVQDGQIFGIDLASQTISQLTDAGSPSPQAVANGVPIWSPDGSQIAFVSNRDGNSEIYLMNADGSQQTNLSGQPGYEDSPAWSPDGTLLAFTSDREGAPGIYLVRLDNNTTIKLTTSTVAEFLPTWSPDGAWLAFIADPEVQMLMRANVADALANNGTEAERVMAGGNTFPVWIP